MSIFRTRFGKSGITNAGIAALFCAILTIASALPVKAAEPDIPQARDGTDPATIGQQIELAAAYLTGRGVKQDEELAAYWYERAAAAGDPQAQKEIGYFYEIGLGVPQDPARAAHWYQLAAAGGLVSAKVNLGVAYVRGFGVPQNVKLGMQLFREAAEKGSGLGACYLGDMYYLGIGVQQDTAQAMQWYEKGVKLHESRAEFDLASILSKRENSDLPRAVDLFRKSISGGYVVSMYSLGLLLLDHPELARSTDEAVRLLDQSSKAGNWKSSAILGVLEREGKMLPLDSKNAYYHFKLATLQGDDAARGLLSHDLKLLAEKLGAQDTATIDAQAAAWHQQHPMVLQFIYKGGENWKRFPAFALAAPGIGSYAGRLIPTSPF
jgi:TPR repeat protein